MWDGDWEVGMRETMLVKKVPIGHRVFRILQETAAVLETVDEKLMILVEGIEFPVGLRADDWQKKVGWRIFVGWEKGLLVATLNFATEVALRLGVDH
jgi:hypothetical protein